MNEEFLAGEIRVDPWPLRGPGGQHVGVRSGIRITHLQSGLTACCNTERSQHRNRMIALDMILGGLTSPHFRGLG